jgi:hypothetical protein
MIALMEAETTNGAREALGEIYRIALAAKTMVLMAQGKPLDKDHPHTAPDHPPSWEKTMEQVSKAEVFLMLLIDKVDKFAKSFDLPDNWWVTKTLEEGLKAEAGAPKEGEGGG